MSIYTETVSYTHLDVYKGQARHRSVLQGPILPRHGRRDTGPEGARAGVVVLEAHRPSCGRCAHHGNRRGHPHSCAPQGPHDEEVPQHLPPGVSPGVVGMGEDEPGGVPRDEDEPAPRRGIVGNEEGI